MDAAACCAHLTAAVRRRLHAGFDLGSRRGGKLSPAIGNDLRIQGAGRGERMRALLLRTQFRSMHLILEDDADAFIKKSKYSINLQAAQFY